VARQEQNPLVNEESLARRVTYERERREWSPGELARHMTKAGCPMNQSSVWKIEHGEPRRRITVDEAIAFAKVFETTLEGLLIPPELAAETELLELLSKYDEYFHISGAARDTCDQIARDLEVLFAKHPQARKALGKALTNTFPDHPDVEDAGRLLLRQQEGVPTEARWWAIFELLYMRADWLELENLSWRVPGREGPDEIVRAAYGDDAEADRGEHQETP
jgi:hypothetical protein